MEHFTPSVTSEERRPKFLKPLGRKLIVPSIGMALMVCSPPLHAQQLLTNGGFDSLPVLLPGQTDVGLGQQKLIVLSSSHPLYATFGIGGIPGWVYRVPNDSGTSSDHGIARKTEVDASGPRALFINNWLRRVSQTVATTVQPNTMYMLKADAFVQLNPATQSRGGAIQLVAGTVDPANQDQLAAGATILRQVVVGTANFQGVESVLTNNVKKTSYLTYFASVGDPNIGKPLTVSFQTYWGSQGPMYFDDVMLVQLSIDTSQADFKYKVLDDSDWIGSPVGITNSGLVASAVGGVKQIGGTYWIPVGSNELTGISESGVAIGTYLSGGNLRAAKWAPPYSTRVDLGTLGGTYASPRGINTGGSIVGSSPGSNTFIRPFVVFPGQPIAPLSLPPFDQTNPWSGEATAINDNDVSAGNYYDWYDHVPDTGAVWYGQTRQDIPLKSPLDINNSNLVCGASPLQGGQVYFAATWSPLAGLSFIPSLPGIENSAAIDLNNHGTIVGRYRGSDALNHAFIYSSESGTRKLDDLLAPESAGWTLRTATGINDSGIICGTGVKPNNSSGGFIAAPVATATFVTGNIALEDFGGNRASYPVTLEILRDGAVVGQKVVTISENGWYAVAIERLGALSLRAKASHWLAQAITVNLTGPNVLNADFSLINGDCDDDNEIGIGDYAQLSAAYGRSNGDPMFDPNADLNGDDAVDIADYALLSANYGLVGD